ncbi:MAG: ABC transporter substrate-binding protein [Candidatus Binatia bacterium]
MKADRNNRSSRCWKIVKSAGSFLLVLGGWPVLASGQTSWENEWQKVQAAARNEGKIVISIPPSPELRKALEGALKQKFGIEAESLAGAGSQTTRRIADEYQAGVNYVDVHISTIDNLMDRLLPMKAVEPLESYWILPEVKDPKNWWGGHIWTDNARRYAYAPMAYMLDSIWYNASLVKPEEVRSFNDLLNPKWKGKIGLFDPRIGGAGIGMWGFLWSTKGEEYLKKLVGQKLLIGDRRVIADALARGKLAVTIGASYYSFASFLKAGLPVKPFPTLAEGTYASVGNGGPVILKNHRHPNASKVFVNWLLSKAGQEVYAKAFGQATRRLDVDTKWMAEIGTSAAKDFITVEQFYKWENQSEDKIRTVREPARQFAQKILP